MPLATSLHEGVNNDVSITQDDVILVIRLGKKQERSNAGPRPLCVRFKVNDKKYKVLNAAWQLKEVKNENKWKNWIYIAHDLTNKQREKQEKVWEEFKWRLATSEIYTKLWL